MCSLDKPSLKERWTKLPETLLKSGKNWAWKSFTLQFQVLSVFSQKIFYMKVFLVNSKWWNIYLQPKPSHKIYFGTTWCSQTSPYFKMVLSDSLFKLKTKQNCIWLQNFSQNIPKKSEKFSTCIFNFESRIFLQIWCLWFSDPKLFKF